jgi:opacity protein-like surface antigen
MKNIVLSAVAVFAMSSFAVAGGDIAPIEEPVVEVPEVVVTDSGFYIGAAYGYLTAESTASYSSGSESYSDKFVDDNFDEIMLQAGYQFNKYVAVEGRYWIGTESSIDWITDRGVQSSDVSIDAWGIYVRPQYFWGDFSLYALLGYGAAEYDVTFTNTGGLDRVYNSDTLDGFSWGIGAQYTFNDNINVYIDYTSIYDDTNDVAAYDGLIYQVEDTISTVNFGVSYMF